MPLTETAASDAAPDLEPIYCVLCGHVGSTDHGALSHMVGCTDLYVERDVVDPLRSDGMSGIDGAIDAMRRMIEAGVPPSSIDEVLRQAQSTDASEAMQHGGDAALAWLAEHAADAA